MQPLLKKSSELKPSVNFTFALGQLVGGQQRLKRLDHDFRYRVVVEQTRVVLGICR